MTYDFIYFILLGLAAGVLSGMFGIGGGIVMVPSLIVIFGMDILDANAVSLTAMLLPVGILGVIAYYKAGMLNVRESLAVALGLFLGSFAGGEIAVNISENLLAKLYAAILICIALSYFDFFTVFKKIFTAKNTNQPAVASMRQAKEKSKPFWAFVLVGVGAGVFAGLFGKGGGIVIVPLLIGFFHYDAKSAVAVSLAALQLPVGLPSVIIYANDGHLHLASAAFIAAGMVIGALAGSRLGIKLPSKMFKKVYAVFLMAVAVFMVYKYL